MRADGKQKGKNVERGKNRRRRGEKKGPIVKLKANDKENNTIILGLASRSDKCRYYEKFSPPVILHRGRVCGSRCIVVMGITMGYLLWHFPLVQRSR